MNPILLEIFKHRFAAVAEEMGVTLKRTAYSSNIKERRDFSCAIFDKDRQMVAQAAHIPVHLGSMPLSVASAVQSIEMEEGDMVMLNDPFSGGTHLPDITLVAPVFINDRPEFYVANRAHHADIGGMSPGSMPMSREIFAEGLIIPPVKIVKYGKTDDAIMNMILKNVRTPDERKGDFSAQIMANIIGIRGIGELVDANSMETVGQYAKHLIDYSERLTRKEIAAIPDGVYGFSDFMDDDGRGAVDIPIKVTITISGETAQIDFSGTGSQVDGCINAVYAVTLSCVLYVIRSLIAQDIPANAGCLRPITVKTSPGTLVDARFPAAVAAGNVETAQRIVDVLYGALARALPERIPAASQGTMNNLTIGGLDRNTGAAFTYYETMGGGMGAGPGHDGESAVHSHMTNTLNTPVEALEFAYPMMVNKYEIRTGSGGNGRFAGGDGIVREITLLSDAEVTVLSERRRHGPYGLNGGEPGACGKNSIIQSGKGLKRPGKFNEHLRAGDILRIETPGGGGYGKLSDTDGTDSTTN
ncbi:MAG: hydantoinase B/oxoprolinase family protein [Deltaproteobacteria bacterium]|nr:hydantoinase B/oxoprolinase family protein [Deltaproteobacteria bacterium]